MWTILAPCTPPSVVYVNGTWAGTLPGTDPDMGGPATEFTCDSFATVQDGIAGVAPGGTVNVAAGTYTESVTWPDRHRQGVNPSSVHGRATTIIKPDFDSRQLGRCQGLVPRK